jgi:hypothetical protein
MKTTILCAALAGLLTTAVNAATIIWQTPTTISGPTDVNTLGTTLGTWAPYNFDAFSGIPVNGVSFNAFSDIPSFNNSTGFYDGGAYYNMTTSDANYNLLLRSGGYGNGNPGSFSWSVTPGHTYLVQLWVNDGRNIGQTRWENFTGDTNTSANVLYGSDGSGLGQYVIGTFVADGSGSQSITMTPNAVGGTGNASIQLNALQVRDITPVPEPTSLALLGVGFCAMFYRSRRNSRGN